MNKMALVKVYDYDYDFKYEQYFVVENNKEEIEKLLSIIEEAKDLDNVEREEKFGYESLIELAEQYIVNNLKLVSCSRYDIDLY